MRERFYILVGIYTSSSSSSSSSSSCSSSFSFSSFEYSAYFEPTAQDLFLTHIQNNILAALSCLSFYSSPYIHLSICGKEFRHLLRIYTRQIRSSTTIGLGKDPAMTLKKDQEGYSSSSSIVPQGKMSANREAPAETTREPEPTISAEREVLHETTRGGSRSGVVTPEPYVSRSRREAFFEESFSKLSELFEEYDWWCDSPECPPLARFFWNDLYDDYEKLKESAEEYKAATYEAKEEEENEEEEEQEEQEEQDEEEEEEGEEGEEEEEEEKEEKEGGEGEQDEEEEGEHLERQGGKRVLLPHFFW